MTVTVAVDCGGADLGPAEVAAGAAIAAAQGVRVTPGSSSGGSANSPRIPSSWTPSASAGTIGRSCTSDGGTPQVKQATSAGEPLP